MSNDCISRKCPGDSFLNGANSFYSFFLSPKDQNKVMFLLVHNSRSSCETFCVFLANVFAVDRVNSIVIVNSVFCRSHMRDGIIERYHSPDHYC